jgi:hypothetical protein
VNQLYWRDRPAYEALLSASETLRAAHRAVLSGRKADLRAPDAAHRKALKTAVASTLRLMADSGQSVSSAAHAEISRTLESLPADEPPGRLTRPLSPGGFEALQGMRIRTGTEKKETAKKEGARKPKDETRKTEEKRLQEEQAAQERERKERLRKLEEARRQERWYRAAIARLQKRVEAAARSTESAQQAWERAQEAERKLRAELREAERALERATNDVRRLAPD